MNFYLKKRAIYNSGFYVFLKKDGMYGTSSYFSYIRSVCDFAFFTYKTSWQQADVPAFHV
jgi:hypothetical protein